MVGENIPYRNLGYGALQDFLEDSKAVCKVAYAQDGSAIVRGVSSDETSHIEVSLRIETAIFIKFKYSGDLKSNHSKSGNI